MDRFSDVMRLSEQIQADAVAFYQSARVPRAFRRAAPMILARAAIECGGDWTRCVIDDDGSITVYNRPQWEPTA